MATYDVEQTTTVEKSGNDFWEIKCPRCNTVLEHIEICHMPWGEDDEQEFTCEHCGKEFTVRPVYKFIEFQATYEYEETPLDKLKNYLDKNSILYFTGTEIRQHEIGRPTVDYVQIPGDEYRQVYEYQAEEYLRKLEEKQS